PHSAITRPYGMRKPKDAAHNNGSTILTAVGSAAVQTLGIKNHATNQSRAWFTQKLDDVASTDVENTNPIIAAADDVYIGLLVSSGQGTTTMVISGLRVKFASTDAAYTDIPLNVGVTDITP